MKTEYLKINDEQSIECITVKDHTDLLYSVLTKRKLFIGSGIIFPNTFTTFCDVFDKPLEYIGTYEEPNDDNTLVLFDIGVVNDAKRLLVVHYNIAHNIIFIRESDTIVKHYQFKDGIITAKEIL